MAFGVIAAPAKARSLIAQTLHTVASMLGNQGLQIAAGIVISRLYGPAGKGLVTYAGIAILAAIAVADGLNSAIARSCGSASADDLAAGRAAARRIVAVVALLFAPPLVALGLFMPGQAGLIYAGIAFPFALFVQTMSAFHLIARRVERTNAASLATNAGAALAMLVAALAAQPPIAVIMAIWTAGYVAGAAIVLPGLGSRGARPAAIARMQAAIVHVALRSSTAGLMTFVAARIDVFIVAGTLSADDLGRYTLALSVGELMWQAARALAWSAYGRIATEPFAAAAALAGRITRVVFLLEVVAATAAFIAGPLVLTLVYGSAFAATGPVLRVLCFGMAAYAADASLSYFINVKVGRPGTILAIEAATLVACAAGSLLTVGPLGMLGPASTTTIAYIVSFAVKAVIFSRATGVGVRSLLQVTPADIRSLLPRKLPTALADSSL